ncbi:MAG TPA: hypothetical protein VHS09_00475 [Polyangiaceae bacterium]|nr:hypothetical protein [Polyangiaceae bacterium]
MSTSLSFASIFRVAGIALALSAAGCVSSAAIPSGGVAYVPLPPSEPVAVYFDERAVGRPFEIVGEVEVDNPGKYHILTVKDAVPELCARARTLGANAILIDSAQPVKSGIISTGIYARARAIRLADAAPLPPVARAAGGEQDH